MNRSNVLYSTNPRVQKYKFSTRVYSSHVCVSVAICTVIQYIILVHYININAYRICERVDWLMKNWYMCVESFSACLFL